MNKNIMDELLAIDPNYPPYVAQECEFFGCNEDGGLDEKGQPHCGMYKE